MSVFLRFWLVFLRLPEVSKGRQFSVQTLRFLSVFFIAVTRLYIEQEHVVLCCGGCGYLCQEPQLEVFAGWWRGDRPRGLVLVDN